MDCDKLNAICTISEILDELHAGLVITDGEGYILFTGKSSEILYGIVPGSYDGVHISLMEKKGIFSPSLSLVAIEKREKVSMIQPDQFGNELLVTATPIFDKETDEILYVISYASWDSGNINELQTNYQQLQKEIAIRQLELNRQRNDFLSTELICKSPKMKKIMSFIDRIKDIDRPVLITGDIGTGKSAIARYIHSVSNRQNEPFVQFNCSAFSRDIMSDELFGYVSVSPQTGDEIDKIGLCEAAYSGTLFLEDIESMDIETQNSLVYLIKNNSYYKKNSKYPQSVDIRIIATSRETPSSLSKCLKRELYYLLSVVSIDVPQLNKRQEDIEPLIEVILNDLNSKYHKQIKLSPEALQLLKSYNWPGNIQELKHVLSQLVISIEQNKVSPYHLPHYISPFSPSHFSADVNLNEYMEYHEKQLVLQAYDKCKTTVELAKYLGISQSTAVRKLQKYLKDKK